MELNNLEKILKSFANKRRLAILKYLDKKRKASVGEIADKIRLSFRSTSKHLSVLTAADILTKQYEGRYIFYRFNENNDLARKLLKII